MTPKRTTAPPPMANHAHIGNPPSESFLEEAAGLFAAPSSFFAVVSSSFAEGSSLEPPSFSALICAPWAMMSSPSYFTVLPLILPFPDASVIFPGMTILSVAWICPLKLEELNLGLPASLRT